MLYRTVLNQVILAARRAFFPSRWIHERSATSETPIGREGLRKYDRFDGLDVGGTFRSDSQLERDMKIGAAGELYVSC